MTPEEQYVQCMDAAYAAADKETCLKMVRKAEGPEKESEMINRFSKIKIKDSFSDAPSLITEFKQKI